MNTFELNTINNVADSNINTKLNSKSPVVEIFSLLANGSDVSKFGKKVDVAVKYLKDLSTRAMSGDTMAVTEINTIVKYAVEPNLLEAIKIFDFMGSYKKIGYNVQPVMRTYKYESIDSRYQASSGDVPFASYSFEEYPIATQTISSGFAVDYREIQSGNFDGNIGEGMSQVKIDMENKAVYYVIAKLYAGIRNAAGVKHFAEAAGVAESSVKDMQKIIRRYGKTNILGDYSVASQLNGFVGYKTFTDNSISFGDNAVAEEIRKTGLVNYFNGSMVVELPNGYNYTKPKSDNTNYELYLPEGLLFFVPQGKVAPLQIFLRGGMSTMTGDDIVTRQRITRFDLEIGAGVAKGLEHQIGIISDTNFTAPTI